MLRGTTIDNIVFGGPAWKVGSQLQPGDVILQVAILVYSYLLIIKSFQSFYENSST
jgi:hypothetical protein